MKKLFLLALGVVLLNGAKVEAMDYAKSKSDAPKFRFSATTAFFSPAAQLLEFAKFGVIASLGKDQEMQSKVRENWKMGENDEVSEGTPGPRIVAKKGIGYNPEKPQSYLPQARFIPSMRGYDQDATGLFYDIRGIQKHAIKVFKNSRSWFEKHPFYFASLTSLASAGSALGLKALWEQYQNNK